MSGTVSYKHAIIAGAEARQRPDTLTTITYTEDQMAKISVSEKATYRRPHHVVYRHFDADGKLLYIGMSGTLGTRMDLHRQTASWFRQIAYVSLEHHDTLIGARRAERAAIRTEAPVHNIDGVRAVDPAAVDYITSLKRPGRRGPRRGKRYLPLPGEITQEPGVPWNVS